jgi:predicted ATPase
VLKNLEQRLTEERAKKKNIEELKAEIIRLEKDGNNSKQEIIDKHKRFYSEAERIAKTLTTELEDKSLQIVAYPRFLEKEYRNLLHQTINLQGTERQNQADFKYSDNDNYIKEFSTKFENLLQNKIVLKNNFNGRKVIERILPESYYTISYEVTYENDKYSEMSEGKQAFVVLKLLLDFSDRKCPIFIDQPEDDLDNRAIFNDLVTYLRKKKKERQIIVVTHNPNIVVGTDAELVLVANQHGINNKNKGNKKFNYAVGSIEHSIPVDNSNSIILEKQGTREHICEILEGGETAFKKREQRYDIKVS